MCGYALSSMKADFCLGFRHEKQFQKAGDQTDKKWYIRHGRQYIFGQSDFGNFAAPVVLSVVRIWRLISGRDILTVIRRLILVKIRLIEIRLVKLAGLIFGVKGL